MNPFERILKETGIDINKYDPSKHRAIFTSAGTMTLEKFRDYTNKAFGKRAIVYPKSVPYFHDDKKMATALEKYTRNAGIFVEQESKEIIIPDQMKGLTLNLDISSTNKDLDFFLTTKDEVISHIAGMAYIKTAKIPVEIATEVARPVVPQYHPRDPAGITHKLMSTGENLQVLNSYIPAKWTSYEGELPDKLPRLFEKLVRHLFPIKEEREYFFSWLYHSLFSRSFVYLVLCGIPGSGKNRLKLVLRALHGHQNTIDGKRSTLTERFNGQMGECTLGWFDELHYDMEMENFMKEIQNDTISIEKKGVDTTRSTQIYASSIISNNKPRDNYIAFDARKFSPLVISKNRLETSMTYEEIDLLSRKVENWSSPEFDIKFVAQIGRWIKKHGKSKKWPHLEYKGPMFYKLAHTSMSQWQKRCAVLVFEMSLKDDPFGDGNDKRGMLWSKLAAKYGNRNGDRSKPPPDFTTVKHFFDVFVDGKGKKTFKTTSVKGDIMGDFYVKVLNKAKIMTEEEIVEEIGTEDAYKLL